MSTLYIVLAVIIAIVVTTVAFVIIGKVEHPTRHININWVLMMTTIVLSCTLVMVLIYHSENDKKVAQTFYNNGYEIGHNDGLAENRQPTNEEMEEWFSSTKEVIVASNEGGDLGVHIIDSNGDEWVLYADSITTK